MFAYQEVTNISFQNILYPYWINDPAQNFLYVDNLHKWTAFNCTWNFSNIIIFTHTAWKVFIFRVFLARILLHSDWIRKDTSCLFAFSPNTGKNGPEKLRIHIPLTQSQLNPNYVLDYFRLTLDLHFTLFQSLPLF